MKSDFALLFLICSLFIGVNAFAQTLPDWKPVTKSSPSKPVAKSVPKTVSKPIPKFEAPTTKAAPNPVPQNDTKRDESQDLLDADRVFAGRVEEFGPLYAYSGILSEVGILYDAASGTNPGPQAATERFEKFPAIVTLKRVPLSAVSYGGAGSSWGEYKILKQENILAEGRYISVWRKEDGVWKIITELAAGVDKGPPPLPTKPNTPKSEGKKTDSSNLFRPDGTLKDALGRDKPAS